MTLSEHIKQKRKVNGLSQVELAERAGVGLRFVRDLEQGKQTLRMDKVNDVLTLFGEHLGPVKIDSVWRVIFLSGKNSLVSHSCLMNSRLTIIVYWISERNCYSVKVNFFSAFAAPKFTERSNSELFFERGYEGTRNVGTANVTAGAAGRVPSS